MKLDVDVLRYLSKDDFSRVLTAVELGMRNHELVPTELIDRIAPLKHGGTFKVLKNCLKHKLLHHDSSKYDGFRLTYLGYDFLAIKTMVNKGVFVAVGRQIGVRKESDIFEVTREDGTLLCMKLHRLGGVSFRAVKSKRDYLRHRSSYNWLYLSRLAALKEFAFMKALETHGFPVPNAVEHNRHCVVMSLVQGYPLVQVKHLQNTDMVFETIIGIVVRLAEHGLIHCDFNEFNIMIDDDEKITIIDFPQMVSVSHRNAQMFNISFQECIDGNDGSDIGVDEGGKPSFSAIERSAGFLDRELAASGFTRKDEEHIQRFIEGGAESGAESDTNSDSEEIDSVEDLSEANIIDGDSSHLLEQDDGHESQEKDASCEAGESGGSEKEDASAKEFLSSDMDETMKKFQNKLTEVELEAEHLLLAQHQKVENDRLRNGNREALTALRKRAQTTKSSVPSPFESIMKGVAGTGSKPLVQEVCNICGNHDSFEQTWMMFPGTDLFARIPFHATHTMLETDQTQLDFEAKKLQSTVKEKSYFISETGALADKISPGILKSMVTLNDQPK